MPLQDSSNGQYSAGDRVEAELEENEYGDDVFHGRYGETVEADILGVYEDEDGQIFYHLEIDDGTEFYTPERLILG